LMPICTDDALTPDAAHAMSLPTPTPVDTNDVHIGTASTAANSNRGHISSPSSPTCPLSPPLPKARHRQASSSSSDDYRIILLSLNMSSMTTCTVLSLNNSKRPMISVGTMTPELLHWFKHHVCGYLQNKDGLDPDKFVNHIVYSFEDLLFSDWYQLQQDLLSALLFTEFMVKVRARWSPKCWQQDLAHKVHSTKQNKMPFSDFIDSLHQDNLLLKGS
jgi:hypothetical protein